MVLAFGKMLDMKGNAEQKPLIDCFEALGYIRGVTYIYALFYRFGLIICVPEEAKGKMESGEKEI